MSQIAEANRDQQGGGGPSISAMPPPDLVTVLREELAAVTAQRDEVHALNEGLVKQLKAERESLDEARAKLKALEENPLTFALANLDAGEVLVDAGEKLKRLNTLVQDRQEKGTLTVKLTVKPFKGEALTFEPDVRLSEPKQDPIRGVFYATGEGGLSRSDPRQSEFAFRGGHRDRDRDERNAY